MSTHEPSTHEPACIRWSPASWAALRLKPGEDLLRALADWARASGAQAAAVASGIGSLARARLRFAGAEAAEPIGGPLEIVALAGTLSPQGLHLHAAVSRADGSVAGGHVKEGCIVRTTAEIVIVRLEALRFAREPDPATGYPELRVEG